MRALMLATTILLVGCAADVNPITLGFPEGGPLGLACVDSSTGDPLLTNARVVDGRVETSVVLDAGSVVYGKVVDRHSRPIPGAIVAAVSPSNLGGRNQESTRGGFFEGRANAEGEYRIEHVDAGVYFLVMARGDEALTPTSLLGSLNFDMLTVPEGEEVEYDIVDVSSGGTRVFGRVTASAIASASA